MFKIKSPSSSMKLCQRLQTPQANFRLEITENMGSRLFGFFGLANKCCDISQWGPWMQRSPAQSWAWAAKQLLHLVFGWVQLSRGPALSALSSHRYSALSRSRVHRHQPLEMGAHEGPSVGLLWAWVIRDWEKYQDLVLPVWKSLWIII